MHLLEPGSSRRIGSISHMSSCSGGSFAALPRSQLRPTCGLQRFRGIRPRLRLAAVQGAYGLACRQAHAHIRHALQ